METGESNALAGTDPVPSWRRPADPQRLAESRVRAEMREVSPDFTVVIERGDPVEAIALAKHGIEVAPRGNFAPLGHYLLAEGLNRQGRSAEAAAEIERGRALEARLRAGRQAAPPQ